MEQYAYNGYNCLLDRQKAKAVKIDGYYFTIRKGNKLDDGYIDTLDKDKAIEELKKHINKSDNTL